MSTGGFKAGDIYAEMSLESREYFLEWAKFTDKATREADLLRKKLSLPVLSQQEVEEDHFAKMRASNAARAAKRQERIESAKMVQQMLLEEAAQAKLNRSKMQSAGIMGGLAGKIRGNSSAFQQLSFGLQDAIQGFSQFGFNATGARFAMLGATNNAQLFVQQMGMANSALMGFGLGAAAAAIPLIMQLAINFASAGESAEEAAEKAEKAKEAFKRLLDIRREMRSERVSATTAGLPGEDATAESRAKAVAELRSSLGVTESEIAQKRAEGIELLGRAAELQRRLVSEITPGGAPVVDPRRREQREILEESEKIQERLKILAEDRKRQEREIAEALRQQAEARQKVVDDISGSIEDRLEDLDAETELEKDLLKISRERLRVLKDIEDRLGSGPEAEDLKKRAMGAFSAEEDRAREKEEERQEKKREREAEKEKRENDKVAREKEARERTLSNLRRFLNKGDELERRKQSIREEAESLRRRMATQGILTRQRKKEIGDQEKELIRQEERRAAIKEKMEDNQQQRKAVRDRLQQLSQQGGPQFIGGAENINRRLQTTESPQVAQLKMLNTKLQKQNDLLDAALRN